ncbi:FHA domain-containing protein [Salinibacterium sp. G-O1]|uniref:FHA domain-containing protein n=1 Tax=Salinibacterium sp. G-O1 TaxID=3046208 RepID=UPI0024B96CEC|nr:FHA domain-containing protein [Salinibacterium sp. G-O1]MDJ0334697.1 FHA domain-containing protein [Salinibacterium sp. G-O1]
MAGELEDTSTTPSRRRTTNVGVPFDDALDELADTVMTSSRAVVDLVEPAHSVVSREDVEAAIGLAQAELPRPTGFYSFQIGAWSSPVMLDRPARVGREPSAPRIATGVAPALIRVDSPSNEVSGTHLEVRQVGSSVVVTDLRSTNGSVVMQPGSIPRKLRQGESLVISPGALVDIGDKNILEILPMQRLG